MEYLAVAVLAAGLLIVSGSVKVVKEYNRLVVFRLGKVTGERGPGLILLIPFVDQAVSVDLREQFLAVPHETCITKDNAPISIDFLFYWRVVVSQDSVVKVADFR